MKRVLFVFLMITTAFTALHAEVAIADSKITEVTVYVDRAHVTREATITIPAGQTNVVFDNLPARVDKDSFRIDGAGNAKINDIVYQTIELKDLTNEKLNKLYTEQKTANYKIQDLSDDLKRISSEEQFLKSIISKITQTSNSKEEAVPLNPDSWIEMMKFYDSNLKNLTTQKRAAERRKIIEKEELNRIQREINKLRSNKSKTKRQAVIVLQAESTQTIKLDLKYMVHGPSWHPEYDLRVNSKEKKMNVTYYAQIRQNSGEDWNRATITLSTAKVQFGGSHPNLSPWYLSLYQPKQYASDKKELRKKSLAPREEQMYNMMAADESEAPIVGTVSLDRDTARAVQGGTSVSFVAGGIYDIASDNKNHKIDVTNFNLNLKFRYSIIPKLTEMAYLKAKTKNQSDFTILPGKSRVFVDGAFVTNSNLGQIEVGQEFWTFLGADSSISVKHKKINTFDAKKAITKKNVRTLEYEIKIKNNKLDDVDVVIWDQIPVSQNQSIKVKMIAPQYKEPTDELKMNKLGYIEWHYIMKPEEEKILSVKFEVQGPKDGTIKGL